MSPTSLLIKEWIYKLPRKIFSGIGFLLIFSSSFSATEQLSTAAVEQCSNCKPFILYTWAKQVAQVWHEGAYEIYMTGYAWHNRYTYPRDKVGSYNELSWGGGLGKGLRDENGNWHGLYAMAFLDSHKNVEPIGGYGFLKPLPSLERLYPLTFGFGYTLFLTMRPDIWHNIPFPGILPLASVHFHRGTVFFTYIPGSSRTGNVLFVFGKWSVPLY
ncbi:MAG: lipid IV(A) palmitoyltransferase PagP [Legionella sp.]|nr:lipid IV(A) palmitoyltransferase PagP [Legionella sp.]